MTDTPTRRIARVRDLLTALGYTRDEQVVWLADYDPDICGVPIERIMSGCYEIELALATEVGIGAEA